jgi:hypothetical protein
MTRSPVQAIDASVTTEGWKRNAVRGRWPRQRLREAGAVGRRHWVTIAVLHPDRFWFTGTRLRRLGKAVYKKVSDQESVQVASEALHSDTCARCESDEKMAQERSEGLAARRS